LRNLLRENRKLIDKVREIEDKFVKVNLYIEKVTEHIAQLDTEIKEKNHELLEVSQEAVEANRFVNSQEIIKSIVSRAIQGVKAINDKTSTNVEEEIKELIKIMEGIEQSMEENKKKHKADNQSLRDKILELEHQTVKVTGADGEPAPEETAAKLDQTIEADKQELTKIQQELHDGHKLDHNLQEQITHLMMEKEKLTDNVALLANLIKTEIAEVEKA
jgi:chromosome segregation ATPase